MVACKYNTGEQLPGLAPQAKPIQFSHQRVKKASWSVIRG